MSPELISEIGNKKVDILLTYSQLESVQTNSCVSINVVISVDEDGRCYGNMQEVPVWSC